MPEMKTYEVYTVRTTQTIWRVEAKDFEDAEDLALNWPEDCYLLEEMIAKREVTDIIEVFSD